MRAFYTHTYTFATIRTRANPRPSKLPPYEYDKLCYAVYVPSTYWFHYIQHIHTWLLNIISAWKYFDLLPKSPYIYQSSIYYTSFTILTILIIFISCMYSILYDILPRYQNIRFDVYQNSPWLPPFLWSTDWVIWKIINFYYIPDIRNVCNLWSILHARTRIKPHDVISYHWRDASLIA